MAAAVEHCKRHSEVGFNSLLIVGRAAYNGKVAKGAALGNRLGHEERPLVRRLLHDLRKLEVGWKNVLGGHFGNRLDLIEACEARM